MENSRTSSSSLIPNGGELANYPRSLERIESREYSEEDERWREYARMERFRNDE